MPSASSPQTTRRTYRRGLIAVAAVTPALLFTGMGSANAVTPSSVVRTAAVPDRSTYTTDLDCTNNKCEGDDGDATLLVRKRNNKPNSDLKFRACLTVRDIDDVTRIELFKGNHRLYIFKVRGHDTGPVRRCVNIPKTHAEALNAEFDEFTVKVRASGMRRYEGDDLNKA